MLNFRNMISLSWFLCLLSSCFVWSNDAMLLSGVKSSSTSSRYFTQEGVLPPLALSTLCPSNQTTDTTPYTEAFHGRSIPVVYTNDPNSIYRWLSNNLPMEGCTMGFDTESLPRHLRKKGGNPFDAAATVQLATPDSCLVVHLVRPSGSHSQACAPILKAVLCDEQFVKAGCALDEDLMSLYEVWGGLEAKSRLDLGFLGGHYRKRYGLKTLCHSILGVDLPKPKAIAVSDWSSVPLTENQVIYSARDAWVGAAVAKKLAEYDADMFGREALIQSLGQSEPPISKLVERQRRRDRAKRYLGRLLRPYEKPSPRQQLPELVKTRVQYLRKVIKARVIDSDHLVFETDHLDINLR